MKISNIKLGILLIFIILLIQTIALGTVVLYKKDVKNIKGFKDTKIENEVLLKEDEQVALDLINQYRNENGLESLKPLGELQQLAKIKAEDLVNNKYFAHNSEALGTPFEMLDDNHVMYRAAGENLAGNITPKRAVEAWMKSSSHRDNILDKDFQYTGLYEIDSDIYGKIFVQLFIGM